MHAPAPLAPPLPHSNRIGALTLTGSAIAFAKLHGIMGSAPLTLPGKNLLNLVSSRGGG